MFRYYAADVSITKRQVLMATLHQHRGHVLSYSFVHHVGLHRREHFAGPP